MKKKKIILIFVPILVVLLVLGIVFGNLFKKDSNSNESNSNQIDNVNYSYNNIYLADADNVLIPLSIKYESFDSVGEELLYLVSMLKKDSKLSTNKFNGLLPSECKVNSIDLNEV